MVARPTKPKERGAAKLQSELEKTQASKDKESSSLRETIDKMRRLQELALGGVATEEGVVREGTPKRGAASGGQSGVTPSSRGRQLLYYESLKNKTREKSSISWRGSDVWAHELLAKKHVEKQVESPK